MTNTPEFEATGDEIEVGDEALELAAGGRIVLMNSPSQGGSNSTYSYNQTIYFQASITDTIT